uniref:Tumor protein p53-inducible protein 13 n=2 Tax=Scophthalmus maximus TaxID=52904 RepID=A0A8D2ZEM5_SCOMX
MVTVTVTVSVLAALWVSVGRCEAPGPRWCDSGKLSLDKDLSAAAVHWDCSESPWPESTQTQSSMDTVYDPEPARQICMDKSISYNHTIPNSGVYRPVRAESGEYVYCPPQRWLNNLHHGATVLLYHPCSPLGERRLLSVLSSSCLSDYVMTPHPQLSRHKPIALVSWGRTLELSTVASSDVCDWLETTTTIANGRLSGAKRIRTYDLLLTRSAAQRRLRHTHPEDGSANMTESLRRCCERTVSSLPIEATDAEVESRVREDGVREMENDGRSRRIRAAAGETQESVRDDNERVNATHSSGDSPPGNRTVPDPPGSSPPEIQTLNRSLAAGPTTRPGSNTSAIRSDSESRKSSVRLITPKHTDGKQTTKPAAHADIRAGGVNGEHNHTAGPGAPGLRRKGEAAKHSATEKNDGDKYITAHRKMKDNEVVDVRERELEQTITHGANDGIDSVSRPQQPQQHPESPDCDDCAEASPAAARAAATAANEGMPRTPRSDEAVWAAAALGFLLVLLTLSVLHTRLYRHWRTTPSLYWRDPRQDYDSVADVIRRRVQIAKRRRKRGRRKECVLLPSSSSSDELA